MLFPVILNAHEYKATFTDVAQQAGLISGIHLVIIPMRIFRKVRVPR